MNSNSLVNALKSICNYLNDKRVDYVVVGGVSVIAWGRSRTTDDIDFIIDHNKLEIRDFVSYLQENNFYAYEDDFIGFQNNDHCSIFYKDGLFRIDIIGIYSIDNKISIEESIAVEFYGIKMNIDSPESLIAHKLLFSSDQDIEDAFSILTRLDDKINNEKLFEHASRLGVVESLNKLLNKRN